MAVDTPSKRKGAASVARPYMRTQEPDATKALPWRSLVTNSYPLSPSNIALPVDDLAHSPTEHTISEPQITKQLAPDDLDHSPTEHTISEPQLTTQLQPVADLNHSPTEHTVTEPTFVVHNAPTFDGPNIANQSNFKDQAIPTFDETALWTEDGGGDPTTWTIQTGTLPTGLSINSSTGEITGTPTVEETQLGVVIRATNAYGFADSNTFDWDIVEFVSGTGDNQQTGISLMIGINL